MPDAAGTPVALTWGYGPKVFEVFLEPTCPNSARAFAKLTPLLERAGEENLTVRITMQSQPWHLFSSVVTRAVLAASLGDSGKSGALRVMDAVYAHREEFICQEHCKGPNIDLSLNAILVRIEELSGLRLRADFETAAATDLMKRHARYSRQNGIHASPTFMIDGLVNDRIGSRDEVDAWLEALGLA